MPSSLCYARAQWQALAQTEVAAHSTNHDDDNHDTMPAEIDFSRGQRGRFFKPGMTLNLPVYLDAPVQARLAAKLAELEHKLNDHDAAIRDILNAIRQLMASPDPPKRQIGFVRDE